jgi:uncharacterized protein (DUF362 family)/NAD-dependent dihydropyrimidine dehydrogenase PreA subunit
VAVSIVRTNKASDVRKAVDLLGGIGRFVKAGEKVILKPNVCCGKDSTSGAVTDPEMVAEVCRMVAEAGATPVVAESPIYPFKPERVFRKAGYADFEQRYGFPFIDIDSSEFREIKLPGGKAVQHSFVSLDVLTCDRLINMPVMKTHLQTVVSLGLKNMKGVVVGKQKHIIHLQGLDEGIVDLNAVIKSDLVIMDGIIGMEGTGGPTNGRAVEMDVIVAGDNVVEADSAGIRIMGGNPRDVEHIKLAARRGLGSMDGFEVLGEKISSVAAGRDLPGTPRLNKLILTDGALRFWDLMREPWARLTGGERVMKKTRTRTGDLVIEHAMCDGCRQCLKACPVDALSYDDLLDCDDEACIRCFCCAEVCPQGALKKQF